MTAESLMFPAPLAVQEAPPDPEQVQVMLSGSRFAEKVSVTVALITLLGPALKATIMYCTDMPAS